MARARSRPRYSATRPRRGEPRRVAARHAHRTAFGRHRAIWTVAAAALTAGAGVFLLSAGLQTGPAGAEGDHTAAPIQVPFAYISPAPDAPATAAHAIASGQAPAATAPVDASALAADGIPATALAAYERAAAHEQQVDRTCGLTWPLLAGIGRVESDHGRFGGAVLHTDGVASPTILGIPLDGHGTSRILDTDHGRLDGDRVFDHAVGPMQFIPSTWALYGIDGNSDGKADPNNIFDAAGTAAGYLCAAGGNLSTIGGQTQAVLTYNDSDAYLTLVLKLEGIYAKQVPGLVVPTLTAGTAPGHPRAGVPPANPGSPLGVGSAHPVSSPVASPTPTRTDTATDPRTTAPSSPAITPTPSSTTTSTTTSNSATPTPPATSPICSTPPVTDTPTASASAPAC